MASALSPSRTRLVPAALLLVPVALIIFDNAAFRALEARSARPLVGLLVPSGGSRAVGDVIFFGLGTNGAVGLRITTGCTTAVLLVPFLLVMAAIAAKSNAPVTRVLTATIVGSTMLIAVNLVRLTGIAWATSLWGLTRGFEVSHFLVGSIFAILGFAGALVVAVRLLVGRSGDRATDEREGRPQPGQHRVPRRRRGPRSLWRVRRPEIGGPRDPSDG